MGREIIRPEISRTFHFGQKGGTSGGQYSEYLDSIQINEANLDWGKLPLENLRKDVYDEKFEREVNDSTLVGDSNEMKSLLSSPGSGSLKIEYSSLDHFSRVARSLGVMDNVKAGVPRTAYKGVVQFPRIKGGNEDFVFIVPEGWKGTKMG